MFVTNWISTTKIQKISEITNFFRHYFLSRTEVILCISKTINYFCSNPLNYPYEKKSSLLNDLPIVIPSF